MCFDKLNQIMNPMPAPENLWRDDYKIPWNDADFSARMLREHLSQDHDLASRKQESIQAMAAWLCSRFQVPNDAGLLDLACGPGLYAPEFVSRGVCYQGIDFGPASIEYARANFSQPGRCDFRLGDLRSIDYGSGFDFALMLYGEINVFADDEMRRIIAKASGSLKQGGRLVLEGHRYRAVERLAGHNSWYKAESGLFSDGPHICLTEGAWYPEADTALQLFHVMELNEARVRTYRSTTRAYSKQSYQAVLHQAGLGDIEFIEDWPGSHPDFMLITARKP